MLREVVDRQWMKNEREALRIRARAAVSRLVVCLRRHSGVSTLATQS
jgi:hypothetical protein